jgi:Na+-translocating ferredoxin:NAD+ oxidoreductase RnfG subunit
MCDAQAAGEGPRCVGCGGRVKTLFVQYSPGNIRVMKCVSHASAPGLTSLFTIRVIRFDFCL